jgi:hypothetical protein
MRRVCLLLAVWPVLVPVGDEPDPFAYFHPTVVVSPDDRAALDGGAPIVRLLPVAGREVGAFTAVALTADVTSERAAAWMRRVEHLRENRYVIATQRLSQPPRLTDFDRLVLDEDDLGEIRSCVPGRCGVKLSATEILALRALAMDEREKGMPRVQRAFRELLLQRALMFTAGGLSALADVVDKKRPSSPAFAFSRLLEQADFLGIQAPEASRAALRCPELSSGTESFLYWSKERLGGRSVITMTHVVLSSPPKTGAPLLMIGAQIYASHYLEASLTATAFVQDESRARRYFVYLHMSSVDLLGGFWGHWARSIIESKVRRDGPGILRHVSERMAAGDPPSTSVHFNRLKFP